MRKHSNYDLVILSIFSARISVTMVLFWFEFLAFVMKTVLSDISFICIVPLLQNLLARFLALNQWFH